MVNCSRNDCGTSLLNASNDSVVGTLVVPHGHSYVVNVYAVDSFGRLSCAVSSNAMVKDKAGMCVHIIMYLCMQNSVRLCAAVGCKLTVIAGP